MAVTPQISDLGAANSLRPGSGWTCVFSQIVNKAPSGTVCNAETVGVRYFEAFGNTADWTQQLDPQTIYNRMAARGDIVLYMEVWENPPTIFIGNDDFIFLSIYTGP